MITLGIVLVTIFSVLIGLFANWVGGHGSLPLPERKRVHRRKISIILAATLATVLNWWLANLQQRDSQAAEAKLLAASSRIESITGDADSLIKHVDGAMVRVDESTNRIDETTKEFTKRHLMDQVRNDYLSAAALIFNDTEKQLDETLANIHMNIPYLRAQWGSEMGKKFELGLIEDYLNLFVFIHRQLKEIHVDYSPPDNLTFFVQQLRFDQRENRDWVSEIDKFNNEVDLAAENFRFFLVSARVNEAIGHYEMAGSLLPGFKSMFYDDTTSTSNEHLEPPPATQSTRP